MLATRAKNLYKKVGEESTVAVATPHKLIVLLYEGVFAAFAAARRAHGGANRAEFGKQIGKAMNLINEGLRASIDMSQGDISSDLDNLYHYCAATLLQANLNWDVGVLNHVEALLRDVYSAWVEIGS